MPKMFNRDELIERILEKHKVVGEGQTATDGQRNIANKVIDPAVEELRETGVVSLDADLPMPIAYKEYLAEFCAFFCAKDFSREPDIQAKTYAEVRMREIQASMPTFQVIPIDPLFAPSYYGGYRGYRGYWGR